MTSQGYAPAIGGLGQNPWLGTDSRDRFLKAHASADGRPEYDRSFGGILSLWNQRIVERQQMLAMDDRLLRDIGISREEMLREARKPFWRT